MEKTECTFKIIHKQFDDLIKLVNGQTMFSITTDEILRYQDVLNLLESRGYIGSKELQHSCFYKVFGSLDDFKVWIVQQENEEKRLNRREWTIAIISTIIGGVIGLTPTIVSLF